MHFPQDLIMQLAKYPQSVPSKLGELARKIMAKKSEKGAYGRTEFPILDKRELGIEFLSSVLKTLSNKRSRNLMIRIKEKRCEANARDNYHLHRLQEHGLIEVEKSKMSLTKWGQRIESCLPSLSFYLEKASKGEQNRVLLHFLMTSQKAMSFSQLNRNLSLNVGSLSRAFNNLLALGLISKNRFGKYQVEEKQSLDSLKNLCAKFVEEMELWNIWMEEGEIRFGYPSSESTTSLPSRQNYFSLGEVINDHIVVTYSYEAEKKREEIVREMIFEQTRWENDVAKPVFSEEMNKIKIAYKIDYVASLQHLVNLFCLHAIRDFRKLLVEHIDIPKYFRERFEHLRPRYGIRGIRKILGVKNRPILQVIIPQYLRKSQGTAKFVEKLLRAGIDEISDHHFIGLELKRFEERIEKVAEVVENQESKSIYYPYIEGEDFLEKIDRAKSIRCKNMGLGISPLTLGIPATIFIRKKYNFPLHLALTLHAVYTRMGQSYFTEKGFRSGHGIHINAILKIFALCGGDEVNVDHPSLYLFPSESVKLQCDILREFNVLPALVGGISLDNLIDTIMDYGNDTVIKVGGERFLKSEEMKLNIPQESRTRDFVGAYKGLIENAMKRDFRLPENIKRWSRLEREMKKQSIIF